MFLALLSAAALAVCPATGPTPAIPDADAPSPDALIACVGKAPITGALFSHWRAISDKGSPGAPADELQRQVMQFLVSAKWMEGEAADRGITLSQRAVRREFTKTKHAAFKTERQFKRFLRETGQTVGDVEYRVRVGMLSERIRRDAAGTGSRASKERRLAAFLGRFAKKWTARTSCQPEFRIDECGNTLSSS